MFQVSVAVDIHTYQQRKLSKCVLAIRHSIPFITEYPQYASDLESEAAHSLRMYMRVASTNP